MLDHERAQSFAAKTWLRRDGDLATQEEAAARPGLTRAKGRLTAEFGAGWQLDLRWGRGIEPADLVAGCRARTLLVVRNGPPVDGPCHYVGKQEFARLGAMAFTATDQGLAVRYARDPARDRLWTRR